jgi:peptidyl-prolyl cis-trans isomerase C
MRTQGARTWRAGGALGVVMALCGVGALGCKRDAQPDPESESAPAGPLGLSAEAANRVLARVGDQVITLGDFAATLERMDRFERLRYQTEDRRRQLLQEMIDVELLAQEAERRGLHRTPEAEELVRQVLRDELLAQLRAQLPPLESIPMSEVRAYYEAHRAEFQEPERRRIAAVVTRSEPRAKQALAGARGSTATAFGELVRKHGDPGADVPVELAGDLGFVTPPDHGAPDNPRVPELVRAAAFEIPSAGEVLDRVIAAEGRFYVVRLVAVNPARDRSVPEAERPIRVALFRQKLREAEAAFEAELRKKFTVVLDEGALARVSMPPAQAPP